MSNITLLPLPTSFPVSDPRGKLAYQLRYGTAIDDAVAASAVTHPINDDLTKFPDGLGTYTKGLKQTSPESSTRRPSRPFWRPAASILAPFRSGISRTRRSCAEVARS